MIGVISKESQKSAVEEFFQLFKIPWEFYNKERTYEVVIITDGKIVSSAAKLLIVFGSETTCFDVSQGIDIHSHKEGALLEHNGFEFPVYQRLATFLLAGSAFIRVKGDGELVGIVCIRSGQRIIRIGYDLFDEIAFLLSQGQPAEHAHIPTVEIHISMLRSWILSSGLALPEIPPFPFGYNLIACLTHDVDFIGIRRHRFDRSIFGFIYRALFDSPINALKGRGSWSKVLNNWKSVLLLPGVYLGIVEDFWVQFDRFMEIERDLGATFFFLPFKDRPGQGLSGQASRLRASRYAATDITQQIRSLELQGCEIAVHGIDAWQDSEKGREEFERVSSIGGGSVLGCRMHWLCFNSRSPENLEKAGFLYDSSFGYNEVIGYRAGTLQVFRPPGAKRLLELPLHIQDTALFYPRRMNLPEKKALALVKKLLKDARQYGGVLTINWHHRSIGPERFWDGFYLRILEELKRHNVWFAKAGDIVRWFQKRRAVFFEECQVTGESIKLILRINGSDKVPDLLLRIYRPNRAESNSIISEDCKVNYFDLLLVNDDELKISL
ncbi:MAG: hypothetical protein ACFFCW_02310 [Candidatus Hodarchaeota archaeon]